MSNPEAIIKRSSKVAWQEVEDKIIVVAPGNQEIHILHGSGVSLWKNLDRPRSFEELVALVLTEYDIGRSLAETDIKGFIDKLAGKGIIECRH